MRRFLLIIWLRSELIGFMGLLCAKERRLNIEGYGGGSNDGGWPERKTMN